MNISARNVFQGTITAISNGPVNAEVELTTGGGDKIVAIVTKNSVTTLGLALGKAVNAYVKAPWVIVLSGEINVRFSARNHLQGEVSVLNPGAVNTEVGIKLPGGTIVYAIITNEAATELGLKQDATVAALIKASHVVLGVPM